MPRSPGYWRNQKLKKRYGLNHQSFESILKKQNSKCAICSIEHVQLNVDHDHETNKVRGLLCMQCNTGLGLFKDSIQVLRKAIKYLKRNEK